jgi:hypothetical protein
MIQYMNIVYCYTAIKNQFSVIEYFYGVIDYI